MAAKKNNWITIILGLIAIVCIHVILTQMFTGLTFENIDKGYASFPGDPTGGMHIFTFVRKAFAEEGIFSLFSKVNPYVGTPFGADSTINFIANLLILGLLQCGNELTVFNLMMWMSYFFSGINTFLLSWYLTRSYIPSVIASVLFAYCPFHVARHTGHLTVAMTEWIPLFFLALTAFYKRPGFIRACFVAFILAIMISLNAYFGFFGIITTAAFSLMMAFRYYTESGLSKTPNFEKVIWCLAPFSWEALSAAIVVRFARAWKFAFQNKIPLFSKRFKHYICFFGQGFLAYWR